MQFQDMKFAKISSSVNVNVNVHKAVLLSKPHHIRHSHFLVSSKVKNIRWYLKWRIVKYLLRKKFRCKYISKSNLTDNTSYCPTQKSGLHVLTHLEIIIWESLALILNLQNLLGLINNIVLVDKNQLHIVFTITSNSVGKHILSIVWRMTLGIRQLNQFVIWI